MNEEEKIDLHKKLSKAHGEYMLIEGTKEQTCIDCKKEFVPLDDGGFFDKGDFRCWPCGSMDDG